MVSVGDEVRVYQRQSRTFEVVAVDVSRDIETDTRSTWRLGWDAEDDLVLCVCDELDESVIVGEQWLKEP